MGLFCNKRYSGVTLIELIVAVMISVIPIMVVGIVLARGQKSWQDTYDQAHRQIQQDSDRIATTFGVMGRKSNRSHYTIYVQDGGTFTESQPQEGEAVAVGQAVEFRYWEAGAPQANLIDVTNTGTHYALFYYDDNSLKLDYGTVGVNGEGGIVNGVRRTPERTSVPASTIAELSDLRFSHNTINGVGQGSVRLDVTLTDPESGEQQRVILATLLRNVWPM